MNKVFFVIFLTIINCVFTKILHYNLNYNVDINKLALRFIVFKEKKLGKLIKNIIHKLEIYHNKSIVSVGEGVISYIELSEDEKTLFETIISLCY